MNRLIYSFMLTLAAGIAAAAPILEKSFNPGSKFDEDPAKYWNFTELQKVPKYQEAKFPESQYKGLKAILYDAWQPKPENPEQVFAYIGYPDSPAPKGGYPGIVMVHGGGGTAYGWAVDLWRSYGYAVIAMDWYNRRPINDKGNKRADLPGKKAPYDAVINVANMIKAHSLLRSLPNVNPDKTAFLGLSWGSWFGAMVASVDPRFKCSIQIYCGDFVLNKNIFINGRFLHAAKVPMYWIAGTNDQNVTTKSLQAAFDRCPTIWNRSIINNLPHSHVGFRFIACKRVMDHFLKGDAPLPKLSRGTVKDGILSAKVLHEGKGIKEAVLCYTVDKKVRPVFKRRWLSTPAKIENGVVSAKLPEDVCQAYLSIFEDSAPLHYCCGSSDIFSFK